MEEVIGYVGAKAKCAMCGAPITYMGQYWDHDGEIKPRHPTTPTPWKLSINAPYFTEEQQKEIEKIAYDAIIKYMKKCLYE